MQHLGAALELAQYIDLGTVELAQHEHYCMRQLKRCT
jgi:hypothetical protein